MIILRQKTYSNIEYGYSRLSKKEENEDFDKSIKSSRKWDRRTNNFLTGLGSAGLGAGVGAYKALDTDSAKKIKRGATKGAIIGAVAGVEARGIYRKLKNSKEKEDQEDRATSEKFANLNKRDDRFNVYLSLKNGSNDGHSKYKKAVNKVSK